MKRLLAVACLLIANAWIMQRINRPPIINVSPADVRVTIEPPALPGKRLVRARQNLEAYRVILDPYVIATFALFTAVGSVGFAMLTWQTNEKQANLLDRQVTIQEAMSPPQFEFRWTPAPAVNSEYPPSTENLDVTNKGGFAKNVTITAFAEAGLSRDPDGEVFVHGPRFTVPIPGYSSASPEARYVGQLSGGWVHLGKWGNASNLARFCELLKNNVARVTPDDFVACGVRRWSIQIEYEDYLSNDQNEFFNFGLWPEGGNSPSGAEAVRREAGEERMRLIEDQITRGEVIDMTNPRQAYESMDRFIEMWDEVEAQAP